MLATAISDIHITCDLWTLPNHLALLGVIRYFTGKDLKLHAVTLALKELQGEHSVANQAAVVLDVLNDFEMRNKLCYFTMDNADTNDTLIKYIADALHEEGVFYNARHRHL